MHLVADFLFFFVGLVLGAVFHKSAATEYSALGAEIKARLASLEASIPASVEAAVANAAKAASGKG